MTRLRHPCRHPLAALTLLSPACGLDTWGLGDATDSTSAASTSEVEDDGDSSPSTTSPGTTTGEPLPSACEDGAAVISDDFHNAALRCAVDHAIEHLQQTDCVFTCEEAQQLAVLFVNGFSIDDMSGLRHLVNLTYLDLADNNIAAVSDLHTLTRLEFISLRDNSIDSVADIPALLNLTELHLGNNPIPSLDGFATFPALTTLALQGSAVTSLAGLTSSTAPALTKLYINSTPFTAFDEFPELLTLNLLFLGGDGFDVTALQTLPDKIPNLGRLVLGSAGVTSGDFAAFPVFPALQELDLSHNQIGPLDALQLPPGLDELVLDYNQITAQSLRSVSLRSDLPYFLSVTNNPVDCDSSDFSEALANFSVADVEVVSDCPP